jgi:hypothetical protein
MRVHKLHNPLAAIVVLLQIRVAAIVRQPDDRANAIEPRNIEQGRLKPEVNKFEMKMKACWKARYVVCCPDVTLVLLVAGLSFLLRHSLFSVLPFPPSPA